MARIEDEEDDDRDDVSDSHSEAHSKTDSDNEEDADHDQHDDASMEDEDSFSSRLASMELTLSEIQKALILLTQWTKTQGNIDVAKALRVINSTTVDTFAAVHSTQHMRTHAISHLLLT